MRWQMARASGIGNQKRAGMSDAELDLIGIKAEMAVAKLLSLDYMAARLGVDDGSDLWFGDVSIDVKASIYPTGKLLFKSLEAFRADCAILVTTTKEDDVMSVIGGISRSLFTTGHTVSDLGRGECLTMEQHEIWPIEEMWLRLCGARYK
jgi:hypothetical protein